MTTLLNQNVKRTFQGTVEIPTDYYLETSTVGWLSVVIPESSINLIENPSMKDIDKDGDPDGFSWGGTVPVVMDYTDGPYDTSTLTVTPTVTDSAIRYSGGFDVGTYTFSVVIRSDSPVRFSLQATDGDVPGFNQTIIHQETFTSNIYWTQYDITFTSTVTPPNGAFLIVNVITTGHPLEIGFWQNEEKPYATTPFNGDFSGGRFESSSVYQWLGIPYASPSCRLEDTFTGGRVVNLKELAGFRLTSIEGLGFAEQDIIFDALALQRGSLLRCKTVTDRDVTLNGVLFGKSFRDLLCSRNDLGKAIFSSNKERRFILQLVESDGLGQCSVCSPCVSFVACYEGGFAGEWGSHFGEEVSIDLKLLQVEVSQCTFQHQQLQVEETLTHQVIVALDEDGLPKNPLLGHVPGTEPLFMYDMKVHDLDGNLYYSAFETVPQLWRYDGTNNTLIAEGPALSGPIYKLECDGQKLYVGGQFTSLTGQNGFTGTSGQGVAEFNLFTQTITDIGDVTGRVLAMTIGKDGTLYIGGLNVSNADGLAVTNFAARDTAGTWFIPQSSTGAALRDLLLGTDGGDVRDMITRENGDIVVVGSFQNGTNGDGYGIATLEPSGILVYHPDTLTHTRVDFSVVNAGGIVSDHNAVVEYRNNLYIGGRMDIPVWNGSSQLHIYNIAYLDFSQYSAFDAFDARLEPPMDLGLAEDPLINRGFVNNFKVIDDRLYIVGRFTHLGILDGSANIEDPAYPTHVPMCGGTIYTGLPTSGVFTPFPANLGFVSLTPGFQLCQIHFIQCGSKKTGSSLIIGAETTSKNDITSTFFGSTTFRICDEIDTAAKIFIEGPGTVEYISINGIQVNINRTIVAGEFLVIQGDSVPVTAYTTFQGNLGQIGLKLFSLKAEKDNIIIIQFTPGTITADTSAYVQYKRQSYSADILCSTSDC